MDRFAPLLNRAGIELADLPHAVGLNGLLVYVGNFPDGGGRIMLHPSLGAYDSPQAIAVIAHELAHPLLSLFGPHPTCMLDLIFDPSRHAEYQRYEDEADRLAAHLLVPSALLSAYPSARYPTLDHMARRLGIPAAVVTRAFAHSIYRARAIDAYLTKLIGCPYFLPVADAVAA